MAAAGQTPARLMYVGTLDKKLLIIDEDKEVVAGEIPLGGIHAEGLGLFLGHAGQGVNEAVGIPRRARATAGVGITGESAIVGGAAGAEAAITPGIPVPVG